MLIVSYDISNDKLRTKFSKFLEKNGHRIQYSLFQVRNSDRVIRNIISEIKAHFEKRFTGGDSILVIPISETNEGKILKFGYAKDMDSDIIFA